MIHQTENIMPTKNSIFVIFGITGDLANRKLLPALYQLAVHNLLPSSFEILGVTRKGTSQDQVLDLLKENLLAQQIQPQPEIIEQLRKKLNLVHMDSSVQEDYVKLREALKKLDEQSAAPLNRLYYLAVPTEMICPIVSYLGSCDLQSAQSNADCKLLIEKPFGSDLSSAEEMIHKIEEVFNKDQIYRVDHYLAKETVQNIVTFRNDNPLFQAVWDNNSIEHILITASETIGIENRVNFYEKTGALRDLIQSHLLQLVALVCMELPDDMSASSIHKAKLELLNSIKPISDSEVHSSTVRGQYQSYRAEVANQNSNTETYAALKLSIQNSRWKDVPILLRTGKCMAEKVTEITIVFNNKKDEHGQKNMLTLRLQPNEGIVLSLHAKTPSYYFDTGLVQMEFSYDNHFAGILPDAYARVLLSAMQSDKTLFMTDEEIIVSWKIIQNVLNAWSSNETPLELYENGSWGPSGANELAENAGASWMTHHLNI